VNARASLVRTSLAAIVWLGGCRPAPEASAPRSHGGAIFELAAQSTAPRSAVYSPDPSDPFNQVHAALFGARAALRVPACAVSSDGCVSISDATYAAPFVATELAEGGDTSVTLFRAGVRPLSDPARAENAVSTLARLRATDPRARPIAAALLQHDLWERFDRLPAPSRLEREVAETIWELALPAATLRGFSGNLASLAASNASFFSDFGDGNRWFEIATCSDGKAEAVDTEHARGAGYRSAVRVFASPPPNEAPSHFALEVASGRRMEELAPGTRLVLAEYPLALSRDAGPVALPIATLVQTRTVLPAGAAPTRLAELAFDVWEARRERLAHGAASGGGFERLRDDRWLPEGVTMTPSIVDRAFPLRASCITCHESRGARLFASTNGPVCVAPIDEDRQATLSIAKKTASAEFAALSALRPSAAVGGGAPGR
jgi:hypothetical protein